MIHHHDDLIDMIHHLENHIVALDLVPTLLLDHAQELVLDPHHVVTKSDHHKNKREAKETVQFF